LKYMDKQDFWMSSMEIRGSQRIDQFDQERLNRTQLNNLSYFIRTSPGWCNILYFNELSKFVDCRSILLSWVFSTIQNEHGYAAYLARTGINSFDDPIFAEMYKFSLDSISTKFSISKGYLRLVVAKIIKPLINKIRK